MVIRSPQDAGKKRSTNAVGNYKFHVTMFTTGVDGGAGKQTPVLDLPVDAVRSLGDSRTNIMRHRVHPESEAVTTPYPGISTAEAITLEGTFLFELDDVIKLQQWRQQARGVSDLGLEVPGEINGYLRDIIAVPYSPTVDSDGGESEVLAGEFKLINCVPVKLSISDLDHNAAAVCNWSLEIEYEQMVGSPPVE
jgi:hypothetical protein